MRFYLNNVEVKVEVAPNFKETLDETLDTVSITLQVNNIEQPYAPMQSFRIEIDNNNTLYYYLATDNVEVASHNPTRYKHILGLVQTSKMLTKPIVRNSSFTQPTSKYKHSFWGISQHLNYEEIGQGNVYTFNVPIQGGQPTSAIPLVISENERAFGDAYVEIEMYGAGVIGDYSANGNLYKFNTLQEWNTFITNKRTDFTLNQYYIYYTLNNVEHSVALEMPTSGLLTTRFKSTQITNLINQGANNLYIATLRNQSNFYTNVLNINDGDITIFVDEIMPTIAIINVRIVVETYNHSAYDILDLLIKRQQRTNDLYNDSPLFNLPNSGELHDLLNKTKAPNFTFTQCSMYECVYEVFKLFDAIFTLDNTNTLCIEYFNDYDRLTTNLDFTSENLTINDEKRVNGFITYYQDARQVETFPSKNSFCGLRSNELGVPAQDDHNFVLAHNINGIVKAEVNIKEINVPTGVQLYRTTCHNFTYDITDYIFEKSIWSLLSTTNVEVNTRTQVQNNTIYWQQGDNKIQLGFHNKTWYQTEYYTFWRLLDSVSVRNQGLLNTNSRFSVAILYPALNNFSNIEMRVKYITTVNGRTKIETFTDKSFGDVLVNQNNGAIDLNKMGLNMLGISLKSGEPTLNATQKFSNWNDRVRKGMTISKDNDIWVANVVNTTILKDDCYFSEIQFVKNFNALSQRIKLLQEKRLSNVSQELTIKSEDNYIEYVYFTTQANNFPTYQQISYDNTQFANTLLKTFNNSTNAITPDFAILNVDISNTKLENGVWTTINNSNCYIPLNKYGAGNCLCFEMSMEHPLSCGNRTTTTSGWFGSNQINTDAIKYADTEGWLTQGTFKLCNCNQTIFSNNFPLIIENYDTCMTLSNYKLYKQPNEIVALNYELCFLPIESRKQIDFLGNAFINDNAFVSDILSKQFYLHYTTSGDFRYNILDTKGSTNKTPILSVSKTTTNNVITLTFTFSEIANIKTWSICDDNGDIYFSSNNDTNGTSTTKTISFITRHTRSSQ